MGFEKLNGAWGGGERRQIRGEENVEGCRGYAIERAGEHREGGYSGKSRTLDNLEGTIGQRNCINGALDRNVCCQSTR